MKARGITFKMVCGIKDDFRKQISLEAHWQTSH